MSGTQIKASNWKLNDQEMYTISFQAQLDINS